jgi:hypothetical protein
MLRDLIEAAALAMFVIGVACAVYAFGSLI